MHAHSPSCMHACGKSPPLTLDPVHQVGKREGDRCLMCMYPKVHAIHPFACMSCLICGDHTLGSRACILVEKFSLVLSYVIVEHVWVQVIHLHSWSCLVKAEKNFAKTF